VDCAGNDFEKKKITPTAMSPRYQDSSHTKPKDHNNNITD